MSSKKDGSRLAAGDRGWPLATDILFQQGDGAIFWEEFEHGLRTDGRGRLPGAHGWELTHFACHARGQAPPGRSTPTTSPHPNPCAPGRRPCPSVLNPRQPSGRFLLPILSRPEPQPVSRRTTLTPIRCCEEVPKFVHGPAKPPLRPRPIYLMNTKPYTHPYRHGKNTQVSARFRR